MNIFYGRTMKIFALTGCFTYVSIKHKHRFNNEADVSFTGDVRNSGQLHEQLSLPTTPPNDYDLARQQRR